MIRRLVTAIIVLPGTVLGIMPAAILYLFRTSSLRHCLARYTQVEFWLSGTLGVCGIGLVIWTTSLFVHFGKGTPAPWDPPKKFVAHGPYSYVRNPMIIGVFLMSLAQVLLFHFWPLFGWCVIFMLANAVYVPFFEEKMLTLQFGEEYRLYLRNVPRWIPSLTAWAKDQAKVSKK